MLDGDQSGSDAVLDVVIVVGDFVGEICELGFESRLMTVDEAFTQFAEQKRIVVRAMLQYSLTAFEAQVEPVEFRVVFLEHVDYPQRLQIVLEAAEIHHAFIQRVLSRMPERCMAEVVGQADGLGQHFIQFQGARDGPGDLRDFQ